jgi:hypothetical protein
MILFGLDLDWLKVSTSHSRGGLGKDSLLIDFNLINKHKRKIDTARVIWIGC